MSPVSQSLVSISIPHTIRAVGIYAVVDNMLLFVPRDVLDDLVGRLYREDDSYSQVRTHVYRACATATVLRMISNGAEANFPLQERLVAFNSGEEVAAHRREILNAFERMGMPRAPLNHVLRGMEKDMSVDAFDARLPTAETLTAGGAFLVYDKTGVREQRKDGVEVEVRPMEVIPLLGCYVTVSNDLYFVPSGVTGALSREVCPSKVTLRDHGNAAYRAWANVPLSYDQVVSSQTSALFSRRLARFDSMAQAISHRTRLAAMFLLPASSTFTRPDEAQYHYMGGNAHCDWHLGLGDVGGEAVQS